MSKKLVPVVVVALAFFAVFALTAFNGKTETASKKSIPTGYNELVLNKDMNNMQAYINIITNAIMYAMDSRTKLCFAFIGVNLGSPLPALATVPCEKIPSELLLIGKKK